MFSGFFRSHHHEIYKRFLFYIYDLIFFPEIKVSIIILILFFPNSLFDFLRACEQSSGANRYDNSLVFFTEFTVAFLLNCSRLDNSRFGKL